MVGERGCHAAVRLLGCTLLVVGFLLFIGDRSSDFLTGVRTHARGPATKGGATQGMSPDRAREIQNVMEQAKRGRVTGLLDLFREPALARQREMMVRMLRQYSRGKEDQRVLLGVLLKQLKPVAVPAAIEGLKDEGALSRVRMAELLGELGDARAVEPLIRAMFDPRAADVAAAALDRLEPNWRTSRAADRIVPLLVRVVQTGTVPPDLRNGYYVEMTRTRNRYGRDEPIKSQAPSPEELKRRGIAFRVAAATALFHLRDSRAAEALLAAITRVTYPPRDGAAEKGGKAAYGRRHRETPAPYVRALTACDPEWVKSKAGRSLVDRWIDDLKGNDAAAAGESVIALGFARDGRAVEPLLGYLEHHVEERSPRSSDVLYERRWQSETVIGSDSWLMDTSGLSPAAWALINIGDRRGAEGIMALSDRLWEERKRALEELARSAPRATEKTSVKPIEKAKESPVKEKPRPSRPAAEKGRPSPHATKAHKSEIVPPTGGVDRKRELQRLVDRVQRLRCQAARVAGKLAGDNAVPWLTGLLKDKDSKMQGAAIIGLSLTRSPKAVKPLKDVLKPDESVRAAVVEQLIREMIRRRHLDRGPLSERDKAHIRRQASEDARRMASARRAEAVRALERLGGKEATDVLLGVLDDLDPAVSASAISALGRLGEKRAVDPLIRKLNELHVDPDARAPRPEDGSKDRTFTSDMRRAMRSGAHPHSAAADALGRIGDRRAVQPLILALSENVEQAFVALVRIDPSWATSPRAREAVPALIDKLDSENAKVRRSAAMLLAMIGDRRGVRKLAGDIGHPQTSKFYQQALDRLDPAWRKSQWAREQVPRLIRQLDRPSDPDPNEARRKGGSPYFEWQKEAARLLGELGDARAVAPVLARFNKTLPPSKQRRDHFGDLARNARVDTEVRVACARALGKLKDVRAVEPLVAALRKEKRPSGGGVQWAEPESVRIAATEALGELGDRRAVEPLLDIIDVDQDPSHLSRYRSGRRRYSQENLPSTAALALAKIGDERALPLLRRALKYPDVRNAAAVALGEFGDKEALELLIATLATRGSRPSRDVVGALDRIDPNWRKSPTASALLDQLYLWFTSELTRDDRYSSMRRFQDTTYGRMPPEVEALDVIDPDWRKSSRAELVLDKVHQRLREGNVSSQGLLMIQEMARPTSIPPLLESVAGQGSLDSRKTEELLKTIDPEWTKRPEAAKAVPLFTRMLEKNRTSMFFKSQLSRGTDVLRMLVRIQNKDAIPVLLAELRANAKKKTDVRTSSNDNRPSNLDHTELNARKRYTRTLVELAAPLVTADDLAPLIEEFRNPDSTIVDDAASLIAPNLDKVDVRPILTAFVHEKESLRRAADTALAFRSREHRFSYGRGPVRWEKTESAKKAVPDLVKALENADAAIRERAVLALAAVGDPKGMEAFIPLLVDRDAKVRGAAHHVLSSRTMIGNIPVPVRYSHGLDRSGWNWQQSKAGRDLVPHLVELLGDPNAEMRRAAVGALTLFSDELTVPPLITALKDTDKDVRGAAVFALRWKRDKRTIEPLIGLLSDKELFVAVVQALGSLQDKRAVPPLLKRLKSEESVGRQIMLLEALGNLRDPRALDVIVEKLKSAAASLRKMRDEGWHKAEGVYGRRRVVERACRALNYIGDVRAIEPLEVLLKDPHPLGLDGQRAVRSALQSLQKKKWAEEVKP